jgi:capsular exopolysaccharide synthesis family protein
MIEEGPAGEETLKERDLFVFANPTSRIAECCRSIRTNIMFSGADKPFKVLVVSSPNPREGKTTTVMYLGTTMAQSGQRVLLIDSDMRRPRLHQSTGISRTRGLSNLVLREADFDDVIKTTDIPNLFVLPCGPLPPNPAELLMTKAFADTLAELSRRYDRILLDSPPVLAVTDAVVLAKQADGIILVAKAGKTIRDDVKRAARQFSDVDANIVGVVLNELDVRDRGYGYYYQYYGYGYGTEEAEQSS